MPRELGPRLIVALDFDQVSNCLSLVEQLDPEQCRLKVGNELFTTGGPALVETLVGKDFDVFLDLKYHDIPNTVAGAAKAAARLGVWMLNVHASGGRRMMAAAREAIDSIGGHQPLLIGVTVLTSFSEDDLSESGVAKSLDQQVSYLAGSAQQSGLDGVVCSAREASFLKQQLGENFVLVTPGIRPAPKESTTPASADDQRRTLTPEQAIEAGSDYLVIGRPITAAADPAQACRDIAETISGLS